LDDSGSLEDNLPVEQHGFDFMSSVLCKYMVREKKVPKYPPEFFAVFSAVAGISVQNFTHLFNHRTATTAKNSSRLFFMLHPVVDV